MNRRRFLQAGAAGALLHAAPSPGWNVLVITSDEHNPKIMGCAGHPVIRTPALDRLAREGTMFTRAYCAYPICAPTRQSLMTGNYPQEHGQLSNGHVFHGAVRTWGDHFHDRGFLTACIGKTHTNNEQAKFGFDYRNVARGQGRSTRSVDPADKKAYEASPDDRFSGSVLENPEQDHDGIVAADSVRWLRQNRGRRFFLHASMVKPHWPWDAPRDFYYMYDPKRIDLPAMRPGDLDDDFGPRRTFEQYSWGKITEAMHRVYRARYYGSLSWLDSNVGRILAALDELKLTERTLVLYTTDHGDMAGEKGLWLKNNMLDASARVPLLIRMPGVVPAGRKSAGLINHVDLFPTLAGLAGAQAGLPRDLSGRNLAPMAAGNGTGRDMTFSVQGLRKPGTPPLAVMARSPRWKFVWYSTAPEPERYVLYDMENDPEEYANVAARRENAEVVAEHRAAVERFLAGLKKPLHEPVSLRGARKEEG